MLSSRNVILVVVLITVISIVWTTIALLLPPDSNGMASDSYGTRASGLRGLYETLGELHIPVLRGLDPPTAFLGRAQCLLLWNPDPVLVNMEPEYLERVKEWVRAGGRLVLVPSLEKEAAPERHNRGALTSDIPDISVLKAVGLPFVSFITLAEASQVSVPSSKRGPRRAQGEDKEGIGGEEIYNALRPLPDPRLRNSHTITTDMDGVFQTWAGGLQALRVPRKGMQVIDPRSRPAPVGRIFFSTPRGQAHTLVAQYPLGKGSITVVSEPLLFINLFLREDDNAVLAVNLPATAGGPVVVDEFYHGLTVRGNPFWILTRHPYGILAILATALTALIAWQRAVRLGPPLLPQPPSRRSLREYVEAMARLFHRSGHRRFLLEEIRLGVLRELRRKLHLKPEHEDPTLILAALMRRDKIGAERFKRALLHVESYISRGCNPGEEELIAAAKEMAECL
ncbi:MAG: DUF4350 domain-containing protein [Planctomycetota bacterium]